MGRFLAAYAVEDLMEGQLKPLWQRDDFVANAHNGARVADLDGDSKDEVVGGTIVSPEGKITLRIPLGGHLDSIFAADVNPETVGLEVVALEEGGGWRIHGGGNPLFRFARRSFNSIINRVFPGGNRVFLYNSGRLLWEGHYKHQEPQNAAVGEFDTARPGLEVWCRSRYHTHQKPFVFDAQGKMISTYDLNELAPKDWTPEGLEVIWPINWTGELKQLAAAKERHKSGDVVIFDPLSGQFLKRLKERADRLYVADVTGDWREEIVVLSGNELHIYENDEVNPNPNRARLWDQNHYRRSKMTWNYYSP
jgi:hypothetical protein